MRELFEQEYKKIEKSLFLIAVGYLHNTEDAKDAVQDAVLSAYQGFYKLKNIQYFKTWLTRIVINKSLDLIRKKKYTEELTDSIKVFCEVPYSDIEVLDAVCRLKPSMSIYITLRFYSDMTYEEIAGTLKQPLSTVKYRTKTALSKLKNILEGDD